MAYIGIFISALIGSGVAAFADLLQKGTAGAVVLLQTTLAGLLGLNLQTLWAIIILMVLGAALCFVFQPQSRQAAFTVGLSVISVIMTATPTKPPGSPAGIPAGHVELQGGDRYAFLQLDRGADAAWPLLKVQAPQNLLRLNFQVRAKDGATQPLGEIVVRARELPGGRIWQWTTDQFAQRTNFPVQFFYDIPVSPDTKSVEVRIESPAYSAGSVAQPVASGQRQVDLSYELEKTTLPPIFNKLFEQRKF